MVSRALLRFLAMTLVVGSLSGQVVTSTVLSSPLNPATYGSVVTITATVSPAPNAGTVTFYNGTTVLGTQLVSSGKASFSTSLLVSGTAALRAYYSGATGYQSSTSPVFAQIVNATSSKGFIEAASYTTISSPLFVVTGDFNRDGIVDLVVPNSFSNSVTVLLGNGDGSFRPVESYAAGSGPSCVAVGDFNGDGKPDLAVVSSIAGGLSVVLGNGDGTFQPAVSYAVGNVPKFVVIADFNRDGKTDVAVTNQGSDYISVLLGNGDGTLQKQITFSVAGSNEAATGDFNNDGITDIVVTTSSEVAVLLGKGDGTFQAAVKYTAGSGILAVAVVDLNGDGNADLAATNLNDNTVSVLLGNGNGTFQPAVHYPAGSQPISVTSGDVDGDGKPDLIIAASNDGISVLLGNGNGTLQPATFYKAGKDSIGVAVGEFNGDGQTDLAVANQLGVMTLLGKTIFPTSTSTSLQSSSNPSVYSRSVTLTATVTTASGPSTGTVTFYDSGNVLGSSRLAGRQATLTTTLLPPGIRRLWAYYSGDAFYSKSTSTTLVQTVTTVPGNGFLSPQGYLAGGSPLWMAKGDFNGDGVLDLAVCSVNSTTVNILLGNRDGTFRQGQDVPAGSGAFGAQIADLNGDGRADLVVANDVTYGTVSVLLGNGDGTFQRLVSYAVGGNPGSLAIADFNRDGKPDLAVVNQETGSKNGSVSILLNYGDGSFQPATNYPVGGLPGAVAIGNFNGSGQPDIAVANFTGGNVSLLACNGDGTFQPARNYDVGFSPTSLAALEVNGDSVADLVVANGGSRTISVLISNGNGYFQPAVNYPTGYQPYALAIADLNGDGRPDIVVTGYTIGVDGGISVLYGNANGTFQAPVQNGLAGRPSFLLSGDFNGDGRPDLAVANFGVGVSVLLGQPRLTTVITLTSSPNPAAYGQEVTLSASVSPRPPSGNVTFYDGATVLGIRPVSSGTATFTTTQLPPGTRSLKARFDPTPVYDSSTSAAVAQVVGHAATPSNGFHFGPVYTAEANATSVAGDFNGDGKPDLAVTNFNAKTVSVFLGNGDGSFRAVVDYPVGSGPTSIACGDFNGDGRPDLTISNSLGNTVTVLLGNGDGTFQSGTAYPAGNGPAVIALGDFNGDSRTDLIVGTSGQLAVLLGNGDGTFQPAISGGAYQATALVVADFNGDGVSDVAYSNLAGGILLGNGDGTFRTVTGYSMSGVISSFAVGDFDEDGIADLAVNPFQGGLTVFLGGSETGFRVAPSIASPGLLQPFVADIDGDGHQDLLFRSAYAGTVSVCFGRGDGTFKDAISYPAYYVTSVVAIGDFNLDGRADLVVAGNGKVGTMSGATASQLKFISQPAGGMAGVSLGSVAVQAQDAGGNSVSLPTTFSPVILYSTPSWLNATASFVGDTASFGSPVFSAAGSYVLTATVNGFATVNSNPIVVTPGSAARLVFLVQPANAVRDTILSPVAVQVLDVWGNVVTSSQAPITVTSNPAGVRTTVNAVNGIATFGNLSLADIGTYTLTAASPALSSALSSPFTIADAIPVAISGQATLAGAGLQGVTITVTGSKSTSVRTDISGHYTVDLAQGGTYTLSAAMVGYSFGPPLKFTNLSTGQTANFAGATVDGLSFVPVTPCRLVDTRVSSMQADFGPPSLAAGQTRTFNVASNNACGIPSTAAAYSLNITVVTKGYLGILAVWPAGQPMPNASTLNSYSATSAAVANAAIVPASGNGSISVYVTDATDLIIDINGYFAKTADGLKFYTVTPCRLVDTRVSSLQSGFGPPTMGARSTRTFTIPSNTACKIPSSAQAYSINVTAVPRTTLGLLSIWPTGKPLPNVSTLNVYTAGTVVANAAIVPAGINGAIDAYVSDQTDLIMDINGYFADPGPNGMSFYPATPCRVADTRVSSFPASLGPPQMNAGVTRSFPVPQSTCGVPSDAGAYSLNFTAVPRAPQLGIFTDWPTGQPQPNVSTMNSYNGSVVANAAIVPAGSNGAINIYVTDAADILFDISGYFAP